MQKILITLTKEEWEILARLSIKECRPALYQAELIFRDALSNFGIIQLPTQPEVEQKEVKQTKKAKLRSPHHPAAVIA